MGRPWKPEQKESFKTAWFRRLMNFFPAYWGSGGRVLYIAKDWREVHVRLRLFWRTRNYVGTIYGGSMYAAVDPFYMIQLIRILGEEYVVWDKAAKIRFRRPGKGRLYARFLISDELLQKVKEQVEQQQEYDFWLPVEWVDKHGEVYAVIEKELYVADKSYYKQKQAARKKAKDERGTNT